LSRSRSAAESGSIASGRARLSIELFERFTERARQVVVLGQDEARHFKHNYIGTEHLLLGLLREEEGVGARVLESLDVTLEEVRAQVARIIGSGDEVKTGQIPFTPRAKKVLELALRESVSLGHNHIGTEHILLGIVRENEGVAARILLDFDADAEVRNAVVQGLSRRAPWPRPAPVPPELVDLPPHMQAEIMRVRRKKERAIGKQSFEEATQLGEVEKRLVQLARAADHEEFWEYAGRIGPEVPPPTPTPSATMVAAAAPAARWPLHAVAAGWALFGVALGLGVLIGRLVWG
jgi:ATP-dependent Clp protease ATP-binding subunit ClpA